MTYNTKLECTPRQQRRNKRTRPEKKNSPMGKVKPKHITKPKNHNKIAELKARRGQHINDDIACSDLEHEHEYDRLYQVEEWHYLFGLIKPRCWPYITYVTQDDGTFSIYADGWPCAC